MQYFKLLLVSSILLLLHSCLPNCKNETTCYIPAEMDEYFGVYKPGNWWVYENQDHTKRDSLYVYDFSNELKTDKTTCQETESREFKIYSSIYSGTKRDTVAEYVHQTGYCNKHHFNFRLTDFPYQAGGYAYATASGTFTNVKEDNIINIGGTTYTFMTDTFDIYGFYYSRGVGLIRWQLGGDTFLLKDKYIAP